MLLFYVGTDMRFSNIHIVNNLMFHSNLTVCLEYNRLKTFLYLRDNIIIDVGLKPVI